ncbi:hypothetical protein Neosp_001556 [[Neocosmospora] mangrovei]
MQPNAVFTFLAFVATSFAVAVSRDNEATDAELAAREDVSAQGCPSDFVICGECNGTSCKIAGLNNKCQVGKCTAQSGGGDGQICGFKTLGGDIHCPGN